MISQRLISLMVFAASLVMLPAAIAQDEPEFRGEYSDWHYLLNQKILDKFVLLMCWIKD